MEILQRIVDSPDLESSIEKCKEKLAELDAIFEKIDYASQITYD